MRFSLRLLNLSKLSFALIVTALSFLGSPQQVRAQEDLAVSDVNVIYNFGEQITFQARVQTSAPIAQASVLFRASKEQVTHVEPLTINSDGTASFRYDAAHNVLAPFSIVMFWFQAALTDGSNHTSPVYYFRYDDNRFPWQQVSEDKITVHWYDGDQAFGQSALDAARAGLNAVSQVLPIQLNDPVDVYVYANADDLQGALYLGGEQWVGGHADPALGVVMTAVTPGDTQNIELETDIPHELAHVMLYRSLGDSYNRLPAWLSEGIASMVELDPKPDYANALSLASKSGTLLPFTDLCASFPTDSGRAFLAYAQSQSFVRYLRDTFGNTGLTALTKAYADGLDCELGATRAVGVPLSQLDARWRESVLGQNVAGVALRNLAPYVLMTGFVFLIPLWGVITMLRNRRRLEQSAR